MTNIIKGGAYRRPDGSWVNAKGQKIAKPSGPVYEQTEEELTIVANQEAGLDEFGAPAEPIAEGEVQKAKKLKTTKKTGGD